MPKQEKIIKFIIVFVIQLFPLLSGFAEVNPLRGGIAAFPWKYLDQWFSNFSHRVPTLKIFDLQASLGLDQDQIRTKPGLTMV